MEDNYQKQTVLKLRINQSWRPATEIELYRLLDILENEGNEFARTFPGKLGNQAPDSVIEQIETLLGMVYFDELSVDYQHIASADDIRCPG